MKEILHGEIQSLEIMIKEELEDIDLEDDLEILQEAFEKIEKLRADYTAKTITLSRIDSDYKIEETEKNKDDMAKVLKSIRNKKKDSQRLKKQNEATAAENLRKAKETEEKKVKAEVKVQKAREVTDAEASAKKNDKIVEHKAREVTDANASAKKDSEEADNIAKPKEGKVVGESEANENDENDPSENEDVNVDKKSKSLEKERAVKTAEKPLEEENGVDEGNEVEEDSKVSKKKSKSKGKELKDGGNAKANQPGIFAMKSPRKEKYDHNVDVNESESKKRLLTKKDLEEQTAAVNKCAKKQDNKFEESKIEESKVDNPMQKPKLRLSNSGKEVEGKTVREPVASKPLRKIPTESNAANEKSNDSTEINLKESKVDATDKAGKMERIPIVSKLLRKCPVENEDPRAIAEKMEEVNLKFDNADDKEDQRDKKAKVNENTAVKLEVIENVLEHDVKLLPSCAQLNNEVKIEVAATFPLSQAQGGELVAPSLNLPQTHTKAMVKKRESKSDRSSQASMKKLRGEESVKREKEGEEERRIVEGDSATDLGLVVPVVSVKPREGIGVHKASKFFKGAMPAANDEGFPNFDKLLGHISSPFNDKNYVGSSYSTFKKLNYTSLVMIRDTFRWRGWSGSSLYLKLAARPRTASAQLRGCSERGVHGRGVQVERLKAGPQCGGHPA